MSVPSDRAIGKATHAFKEALSTSWQQRRVEEDKILQAFGPASDRITAFLNEVAVSVSEVTGQEAKVEEMTGTIRVGRGTLLTHHTILHPAGDFNVRVLHARDGLEYRGGRSDVDGLCARILRDALVHFGPKPM
jgi:hypothetical protein